MLIGARVAQGAFGAILLPQGISLLTKAFSEDERSKAFSAYAPVLSLAAVAGPLAAGALIRWDLGGAGWRLIFLINLVLGAATLAAALRYLPADGPATLRRLDPGGVLIAGAATFGVVYPLIQGRTLGWPWWTFAVLAAGLAGFGWFAHHERRSSAPLIEPTLLRRHRRDLAHAVVLRPVRPRLHRPRRRPAADPDGGRQRGRRPAGHASHPRWGGRATIQACLAVALAGLIALAVLALLGAGPAAPSGLVPPGPSGLVLAAPILVLGVGLGGAIAPLFSTVLTGVTPAETGSASGSLGAVQQLAGSAGVATLATLYAATDHPAAHGLAVTALATAALLAAGVALTFLLPGRRSLPTNHHDSIN
jgi:MFS family permease